MRRALGFLTLLAACTPKPQGPETVIVAATPGAPPQPAQAKSCRVVASLPKPLRIIAYVTGGHPKLDAFTQELRTLFDGYVTASKGNVAYEIRDTRLTTHAEAAKAAGIQTFDLAEEEHASAAEHEPVRVQSGLVLEYAGEHDALKFLPPNGSRGLDFWIANKVAELRTRAEGTKRRIGVSVGHGELSLREPNLVPNNAGQTPSIHGIVTQYFPFYELVDVDVSRPGPALDKVLSSLEGLLVTQPTKDFTDEELRRIDAFTIGGKSLVVVASAVNVKQYDRTMLATLSAHGLEHLLGGYGIEMRKDALVDFGQSFQVEIATQSGATRAKFPALLHLRNDGERRVDTRFGVFFRIPEVAFPFASSLVVHPERQPGVPAASFRVVARSSRLTARFTTAEVDLSILRHWTVPAESGLAEHAVAVTVEGKLRSAFGGHASSSTRSSRVLVLSSSQLFANPFARAGNDPNPPSQMGPARGDEHLQQLAMPYAQQILTNTILVAKNTLDWMTMNDDLAECSSLIVKNEE